MAKLTDKQRKTIIAERAVGSSTRQLARKYGVSETTIRRTLKSDPEMAQKVAQKKAEHTASILAFMDSKKTDVCTLVEKILAAMGSEDKLAEATLNQLATAMGIVIDKFTAQEQREPTRTDTGFLRRCRSSLLPGTSWRTGRRSFRLPTSARCRCILSGTAAGR